jgi:hypothetical protein
MLSDYNTEQPWTKEELDAKRATFWDTAPKYDVIINELLYFHAYYWERTIISLSITFIIRDSISVFYLKPLQSSSLKR